MTKTPGVVVWIVDDVAAVRKSIGAVLETADITVRDYGSAGEFLADYTPVEPSCLIVDHHMPDMTGLELLFKLRKDGIGVPVIVITGNGDDELKQKSLASGAVAMLHKPVDGDELIALIEKVIAGLGLVAPPC